MAAGTNRKQDEEPPAPKAHRPQREAHGIGAEHEQPVRKQRRDAPSNRSNQFLTMGEAALAQVSTALTRRMKNRPYATIAIAAGIGFAIGGRYWKLLARPLLTVGARVALSEAVRALSATQQGGEAESSDSAV